MKIFFTALLIITFSKIYSQDYPKNKEGRYEFTEVVTVDSVPAATLHARAELFISKVFNSGKSVIQVNNLEAKQITGKGNIGISIKESFLGYYDYGNIEFEFTIQCKDGRYRYFISDFNHQGSSNRNISSGGPLEKEKVKSFGLNTSRWNKIKEQGYQKITAFIVELKEFMKGAQNQANKDW